ncbi:MAG: 30S ribosomal protein S16, partial [Candidatus Pacebacteria bacterium]|nr:30S ribosomal protein S16 [Candidatus Paceibacterota bacterium]
MITIRLLRIGKKKQPSYKIVVTNKKNSPSAGRFIQQVGFYNPITKEKSINGERVNYWISKGASVSDTVYNLLISEKIIEGNK